MVSSEMRSAMRRQASSLSKELWWNLSRDNIIQHTGWGIGLQDDAKVFSIRTNTFQNNQTHIRMTGNGRAYILSNQMLLAEYGGIIVEAERGILDHREQFHCQ
jgi:hypothetical protein